MINDPCQFEDELGVEISSYNPSRFYDPLIGQDEIIIDEMTLSHKIVNKEKAHAQDQNVCVEMTMPSSETEPMSQII